MSLNWGTYVQKQQSQMQPELLSETSSSTDLFCRQHVADHRTTIIKVTLSLRSGL